MPIPSALGFNASNPFGSYWTRYPAAVHNVSHFVQLILKNSSRMRCVTKTNELTETAENPGGGQGAAAAHRSWVLSVKTAKPDFPILYGIDPGGAVKYYPPHYAFYRQRLIQEATWAIQHGIKKFQVGNEHEVPHASGSHLLTASSLVRTNNVVVATIPLVSGFTTHGFETGQEITVSGATPSTFNVADSVANPTNVKLTVIDATHVSYPSIGADGSATGSLRIGWSFHQERLMVKADCVAVRAIDPSDPDIEPSYSCSQDYEQGWINDGINPAVDLKKIYFNIYGNGNPDNYPSWKATLDKCFAAFGSLMGLTELNASHYGTWNSTVINGVGPTSLAFYKQWEEDVIRRWKYASETLGITEIYLYTAWDIQNNFAFFYNEGSYNGQPTATLELTATFSGRFLPVVDILCGRKPSSVFLGTMESQ